jgi:hypothetical protein
VNYLPATPGCSTSTRWGWNMHSGASNRSGPILMIRPSGSYGVRSVYTPLAELLWRTAPCRFPRGQSSLQQVSCRGPGHSCRDIRYHKKATSTRRFLPDIAQFLLDLSYRLKIGSSVESVTPHKQQLDKITCDITTSDIEATCEVGKRETVVYGDDMRYTVTGIHDNASGET